MSDNDETYITEYGPFGPTREFLLKTGIASLEETQRRLEELLRVLRHDPDDIVYVEELCRDISIKGGIGWDLLTTYYLSRECVGNA